MSEVERVEKEEIIKDSMLKAIKGSEAVALQAVDSTATVIRAGLTNTANLSMMASDILLNTARKAIEAGSVIGRDICGATMNIAEDTMHAASELSGELKKSVSATVQGKTQARKPEVESE